MLSTVDYIVFGLYVFSLIAIATFVSRNEKGHERTTEDYFLAGKSLPWWAVGASLIAANISAEQIIGMSGAGYVVGMAIASYEWMAALSLIIVAKFFLPVFLKHQIYTMPQFLEERFGTSVKLVMSVYWLAVYIFVNLTTILWLGAMSINSLTGLDTIWALAGLASFALAYSIYGGLKAVAFTDIIQVVLLIFGGALLTYIVLQRLGGGEGFIAGFSVLIRESPEKFDMILSADNPQYKNLPGLGVVLGGMWIMNLSYWGFNQYIIQRALAARSLREAQKGVLFAASLKIVMPFIIVIPGIAAAILAPDLPKADHAYPEVMKLAPPVLRGLIFSALVAAIVSSVGSMMNSISTIFTMDLYRQFDKARNQAQLVWIGRGAATTALLIAVLTARPLLEETDQILQFIQNFTGFVTPAIVAIFLLGIFWKGTTTLGALASALCSGALSIVFFIFLPEVPFMDRVGFVFLACLVVGVLISLLEHRVRTSAADGIDLREINFTTSREFNLAAVCISAVIATFYVIWW